MRVIVFDVNETLLDLNSLKPQFEALFGTPSVLASWFSQLLHNALLATVLEDYRDFGELALAALDSVAARRGVRLSQEDKDSLFNTLQTLEPHPDVTESLDKLKHAGFRLAALSNSPYRVLTKQLSHARLAGYFDMALSVDEVKRFKPHPAVYRMAATRLGVAPADLRMVAAHAWDTTGAQSAGCQAAFVARPGKRLGKLDIVPGIEAATLTSVAEQIISLDGA